MHRYVPSADTTRAFHVSLAFRATARRTLYCVCSGAGGLALGVIGTHLLPRRLETGASSTIQSLRIP